MASPDFDPYAVLDLPPNATPDEIRAAYRRRAAECHPDVLPPEKKAWAVEQMVQLNAARDLLLNFRRRVQYHREHAGHLQWQAEKAHWRQNTSAARTAYAAAPRPQRRSRSRWRSLWQSLWPVTLLAPLLLVCVSFALLPYLMEVTRDPRVWEQFQALAIQQFTAGLASLGRASLAALPLLFLAGLCALVFFGLSRWRAR